MVQPEVGQKLWETNLVCIVRVCTARLYLILWCMDWKKGKGAEVLWNEIWLICLETFGEVLFQMLMLLIGF